MMAEPADVIPIRHALYNPQAQVCADCHVRRFALFGALSEAALDKIHVQIADVRLSAGESLFGAMTPGTAAYTVRSGVVRLERITERGERRILRLAGRGDTLGLESVLGQSYACDAIACNDVQLCRVPRSLIDELSLGEPQLMRDMMKRWQRALDDADEWLTELCTGPARHRVLRLLLKLSEYAESPDLPVWLPSRQEMSAMLDMTVETASRLISQLKREGVLTAHSQRHATLHMDVLMKALRDASAE